VILWQFALVAALEVSWNRGPCWGALTVAVSAAALEVKYALLLALALPEHRQAGASDIGPFPLPPDSSGMSVRSRRLPGVPGRTLGWHGRVVRDVDARRRVGGGLGSRLPNQPRRWRRSR